MENTKNNNRKTTKTSTKKTTKSTSKNETKKVTKPTTKSTTKQSTKTNTNKTINIAKNTKRNNKLPIILIVLAIILFIVIYFLSRNNDWIQNGNIISKGDKSYEIGDYYNYDESNNGKVTGLTDVKWKVLGIDDNGNLLIMSASSIGSLTLGDKNSLEKSQQDYIEGSQKVNDMTKNYGNGKGAISVRSFTNSDLVKLSNYTDEQTYEEYTYYWTNEVNPKSISKDGNENSIKLPHNNNFVWYDENTKTWHNNQKTGTETSANPIKITTVKDNRFGFDNSINYTENYRLPIGSKSFNMVYLNDVGEREMYWTNNSFVNATERYVAYGQNVILYNAINYRVFVYSSGNSLQETAGVRAVVTID